jgi:hypothetical protein
MSMRVNERIEAVEEPHDSELALIASHAAQLEVDPMQPQPIAWLNKAHHETLIKGGYLTQDLARQVKAFEIMNSRNAS